jgi:hypothetical protein
MWKYDGTKFCITEASFQPFTNGTLDYKVALNKTLKGQFLLLANDSFISCLAG